VSRLKVFIQYTVIVAVTVLLVWFSLRGLQTSEGENKWEYLLHTWQSADKGWLMAMAVVAMASHLLRAERWRMLMVPTGHHTKLSYSFYSLMTGYLVNLVIPRGGEVSRCYNLYRLDKTPVDVSFGTVVVERMVDLLCLVILVALSFFIESKKLFAFIDTLPIGAAGGGSKFVVLAYLAIGGLVVLAILIWLMKKNEKIRNFVVKTWRGFREGLLSIFKLKNKGRFVTYSLVIWLLYFLMSYTVIRAFPATSELGFGAVLSLFAIGAIAMAVPLPGGTGSYHVLVPQGLILLYNTPENDAVAFTFIFHGWQTLIMIVWGAVSLLITSYQVKKRAKDP
jgi:hypothetical protein